MVVVQVIAHVVVVGVPRILRVLLALLHVELLVQHVDEVAEDDLVVDVENVPPLHLVE